MSRLLCYLIHEIGRRGMVLAIIGLIWLLYGLGMILGDPVTVSGGGGVWHLGIDPDVRGTVWSLTGFLAIYTAASQPRSDTPGFLALTVCPMVYAFSYLTAWIVWALPLPSPGYAPGLISALSWASVITLVAVCASWPEPSRDHSPGLPPGGRDG